MAPRRRRDEARERESREEERQPVPQREGRSSEDEREDEGWSQPESSAQKGTESSGE